jgi:two-component system, LytTR family, sensor kinase
MFDQSATALDKAAALAGVSSEFRATIGGMERLRYDPADRHLNWQIVLFSILGFWLLYVVLVSIRAHVIVFPAQGEMAIRRGVVTAVGIVITIILWLCLRRFDRRSLGVRIAAAALLAVPAALLVATANYIIFRIVVPCDCPEVERELPNLVLKLSMTTEIAEVAIDRYFFLIAWCAIYLALGFAGDVGKAERKAAEFARAAQSAELRALRYQVNPHFLFNTLNALSSLVMHGRSDEAETMIMNLATFYRTSLTDDPSEDVSLGDEVALQQLYLDIEKVRFPGRLSVVIDVPEALRAAPLPGLILQPLVENAIKHGVSRTSRAVTIRISAERVGEMLQIAVADDAPTVAAGPSRDDHGIGLANVRDRLAARFGDRASLSTQKLETGGFEATIMLPMVPHDQR